MEHAVHYTFTSFNVGDPPNEKPLATEWFGINNKDEMIGTCWGREPIQGIRAKLGASELTVFRVESVDETNGYGINDSGMLVGRIQSRTTAPRFSAGFYEVSVEGPS